MVNKQIFKNNKRGGYVLGADALNQAGGVAYAFSDEHALAQYAVTGCFNGSYYASAKTDFDRARELASKVDPEFLGKLAIYGRTKGYMKDVPAFLTAMLSVRSPEVFQKVFPRVIDNGKMVRVFTRMIRSGEIGRSSLASAPARAIKCWLDAQTDDQLFKQSYGKDPSIADVIRLVHAKPRTEERQALYRYLLGYDEYDAAKLPQVLQHLKEFRRKDRTDTPKVPFMFLTSLDLTPEQWKDIARNATWQTTRMNLNTFKRHGVLDDPEMVELIARRLSNPQLVQSEGTRAFPYQLLAAYKFMDKDIPVAIRMAIHDAMEVATRNVPELEGNVVLCPDVSGSMTFNPVTGQKKDAPSNIMAVDAAALMTASILRKSPQARVLPFHSRVVDLDLEPRDTVMTNANKIADVGGGATYMSKPLELLNERSVDVDTVIFISDLESWVDSEGRKVSPDACSSDATALMEQWRKLRSRNPEAKMVCIDVSTGNTTQAPEREDVLNIGGFSDNVFPLVADFVAGRMDRKHWLKTIEEVEL